MQILEPWSPFWAEEFRKESTLLHETLKDSLLDIEHIGSTSLTNIAAKPIIDIAVAIESLEDAQQFIEPLSRIAYEYFPESSSQERFFFRKGDPVKFHLSLAQKDKFSYWKRQILFRDYLRTHPDMAREYEALKFELLAQDPTGSTSYLAGKTAFVEKILKLAEHESL